MKLPKTTTKIVGDAGRSTFEAHQPVFAKPTTLWFRYPAHGWIQALPIGNGGFGGMVFGGLKKD
ncbi:MAG: glycoside hydrolase N-terminal domain-containing protein, partial [Lentisphaeraceae bacterium]|nr:glycoside hydrolase N-terminal domain-containing protein [Lentisphaeraceae bacterium]